MRRFFWWTAQVAIAAYFIYWYNAKFPEDLHRISLGAKGLIGLGIGWLITAPLSKLHELLLRRGGQRRQPN